VVLGKSIRISEQRSNNIVRFFQSFGISNYLGASAYSSLMMEAVRTSETSVDNHFTRQYNPEDSSEHHLIFGLIKYNILLL
jgi:hypothetical protein